MAGPILGGFNSRNEGIYTVKVALVGHGPLWVTDENGRVEVGDLITPSKTVLGYGMRADTDSEQIVGMTFCQCLWSDKET